MSGTSPTGAYPSGRAKFPEKSRRSGHAMWLNLRFRRTEAEGSDRSRFGGNETVYFDEPVDHHLNRGVVALGTASVSATNDGRQETIAVGNRIDVSWQCRTGIVQKTPGKLRQRT